LGHILSLGCSHLPKISSQDSKWFGRSVGRKFGAFSPADFSRGAYFQPCPGCTDNLSFSCQRVFISSTDTRSVVPIVGSPDLVPEVPITWFLGASKPISVLPTWAGSTDNFCCSLPRASFFSEFFLCLIPLCS
jgi:hypothetical protein